MLGLLAVVCALITSSVTPTFERYGAFDALHEDWHRTERAARHPERCLFGVEETNLAGFSDRDELAFMAVLQQQLTSRFEAPQ